MSKKNARSGGKFGGGHTTVIPAAGKLADIAHKCEVVTKILPGFIKTGLSPAKGLKRVKIAVDGASILLSVRDNISHQELRVYSKNLPTAIAFIAVRAKEAGFSVVQ